MGGNVGIGLGPDAGENTMSATLTDPQVLTDYWQRLDRLTDRDWAAFYQLVRRALLRCPASELTSLPGDRESYITEFFTEKIFFKAQRMTSEGIQSISGGALCFFFRNFLKDELRDGVRNPAAPDAGDDEQIAVIPDHTEDRSIRDFVLQIGGSEKLEQLVASFLATLEDWALLMLRGHFCSDDAVPMSKLCKGIPSYHYKAQGLGITVKKDGEGLLGYEHTRIGRWIQSLGVAIEPGNTAVIKFLLEVICLEATAVVEGEP